MSNDIESIDRPYKKQNTEDLVVERNRYDNPQWNKTPADDTEEEKRLRKELIRIRGDKE
jgi:hypothetical protein